MFLLGADVYDQVRQHILSTRDYSIIIFEGNFSFIVL
jgi:hypothetical protein